MGNYYTRIIRIYKKSKDKSIDVEEICSNIKNTAHFEHELIWYNNDIEKCLDIKWNAKRAGGEINLNFEHFDIWEIRGHDSNQIFFNNEIVASEEKRDTILFSFDEIQLDSNHKIINDEYFKPLIDFYLEPNSQSIRKFKITGYYSSSCDYEIGEVDVNNLEPTKNVELIEFLKPRGESICINQIITDRSISKGLNKFVNFVCSHNEPEMLEMYNGFNTLKFLKNGRVINEIFLNNNPYDIWQGRNADWWDNCCLPKWIEYKTLKNKATHDS